jgi:hypothetical protein
MRVGISGHQKRAGLDWGWVGDSIRKELGRLVRVEKAISSLASGSDQLFANVALQLGIPLLTVVPSIDYENCFDGESLRDFRFLCIHSEIINLSAIKSDEAAFLAAGQKVVDLCSLLFAVWDGKKSKGLGGTADIVDYAVKKHRSILHFDPFLKTIKIL